MKENDIVQIKNIIQNFESTKEYIPFISGLLEHPTYGPIFQALSNEEQWEVDEIITQYIIEKVKSLRTKWWLLFKRFFENENKKFWKFRRMNENEEFSHSEEFQILWKEVEEEMFKLEWILTQAMMKKAQWLGKTVEAFYNVVYSFFPLYGNIE